MTFNDYLSHHGIKGQKWGVENGPPYPLNPVKDYSKLEQFHNANKIRRMYTKNMGDKPITLLPEKVDALDFILPLRTKKSPANPDKDAIKSISNSYFLNEKINELDSKKSDELVDKIVGKYGDMKIRSFHVNALGYGMKTYNKTVREVAKEAIDKAIKSNK